MPVIEVEISDDGKPVKVPGEVQKLIDAAFGRGRNEGADTKAKELTGEIDRLKKQGELNPAERERLKTLESDHSRLSEELARERNDWKEADRIRNERHANELKERDEKLTLSQQEIAKRTTRVQELIGKDIRATAIAEGARAESLDELELLLGSRIGLDDGLQAFVKDAKEPGKPALDKDGNAVTVEGFVKQYLTDHSYFKAAPGGRGGGARGGRSTTGDSGHRSDFDAAVDELAHDPSPANQTRAVSEYLKRVAK